MERSLLPTVGRRGVFAPLVNLRGEMDKLFDEWLGGLDIAPLRMFEGEGHATYVPRIDVVEREAGLEVSAELPGVEEKDLTLELTPRSLILKGEKRVETEVKEEGMVRLERRYGAFFREIPLPWEVEVAKVTPKATFENGVLTIKVPKPAAVASATKKIAIHA
jgi:HSP20 family protein